MFENIRIALSNLNSNRIRTVLTMLGVTIGVAAVIVLVSVGQSFESFVIGEFEGLGVNLVFVIPNPDSRPIEPLTFNDVNAVSDRARVPDAAVVMPQNSFNRTVRFGTEEVRTSVSAVTPQYMQLFSRRISAGRFFDESDMDSNARVAVLEPGTAEELFAGVYPIGQSIRIGDVQFVVIGVLAELEAFFGFSEEDGVIIPITTAQTRLNNQRVLSGEQTVNVIIVQGSRPETSAQLVQQLQNSLRESRDISFRDEDNFLVFSQNEILDILDDITGLLTVFLAILASISLLVGGIGIMNIMLVTVTERTREIGLRKAVGAQNFDILLQFLTEAVILSGFGGAVGVGIAAFVAFLVTAVVPNLSVVIQFSSILLASFVSVGVGVLSGIYPASRAAGLKPIDALRYE